MNKQSPCQKKSSANGNLLLTLRRIKLIQVRCYRDIFEVKAMHKVNSLPMYVSSEPGLRSGARSERGGRVFQPRVSGRASHGMQWTARAIGRGGFATG
jgi:hypothetical protein